MHVVKSCENIPVSAWQLSALVRPSLQHEHEVPPEGLVEEDVQDHVRARVHHQEHRAGTEQNRGGV